MTHTRVFTRVIYTKKSQPFILMNVGKVSGEVSGEVSGKDEV